MKTLKMLFAAFLVTFVGSNMAMNSNEERVFNSDEEKLQLLERYFIYKIDERLGENEDDLMERMDKSILRSLDRFSGYNGLQEDNQMSRIDEKVLAVLRRAS